MKWKETHDNEYYIKCFKEQVLDKLTVEEVITDLCGMINSNEHIHIALVCYEKPEDFCHRHLVADWFRTNGIECKEWEN